MQNRCIPGVDAFTQNQSKETIKTLPCQMEPIITGRRKVERWNQQLPHELKCSVCWWASYSQKMWKYSLPSPHSSLFCTIVVHTDRTVKLGSGRLFCFLFFSMFLLILGRGKGQGDINDERDHHQLRPARGSSLQPEFEACALTRNRTPTPWFIGLSSTTEPSQPGRISLIWPRMT